MLLLPDTVFGFVGGAGGFEQGDQFREVRGGQMAQLFRVASPQRTGNLFDQFQPRGRDPDQHGAAILGRPVAPSLIGRVVDGGPVAQAGLKTGDRIAAIDGRAIRYWEDVQKAVQDSRGSMLSLTVQGPDGERKVGVTPTQAKTRDLFGDERAVLFGLGDLVEGRLGPGQVAGTVKFVCGRQFWRAACRRVLSARCARTRALRARAPRLSALWLGSSLPPQRRCTRLRGAAAAIARSAWPK